MATCVQILRDQYGIATASQPNLSRWETGRTAKPTCIAALTAYTDAYGDGGAEIPPVSVTPSDAAGGDIAAEFEELAGEVAGEPLLGPSQLELVSGMSQRLAHGPPLSAEDRVTYLDQLKILRVPRRW